MFRQIKTSILGVDISSSTVKVLELSQTSSNYSVESYAVEPLPLNAVVEGRIDNVEEVASAIKRAVKKSGTKLKEAAVAVSANSAITKVLSFPADMSEREMEEQIMLEADNHIPYPLDEVRLDFEVIGPSEADAEAVDVLLAASRSEYVDTRIDALEDAGLKVKIVDIEAYAIENVFALIRSQLPNQGQSLTVAVLDIGASVTTLHVLVDGKIVYTREQNFGGRMLTEDIERHYGMSHQEASLAKEKNDLAEDYDEVLLTPFKQSLTNTVTRALQFFLSASTQSQSIDYILLAGGCASIKGIELMIEQETATPTFVANPFSEMGLGSRVKIQSLSDIAPSMLIACGLAMRSFD